MRRILGSVRARITLLAASLVAIALAAGGVLLVVALNDSLVDSRDAVARSRAQDIASLVAAGALPEELTVPSDEDIAQVVDPSGAVAAASENLSDRPPITDERPELSDDDDGEIEESDEARTVAVTTVDDDDLAETLDYRVWSAQVSTSDGVWVVYAGRSLESVQETVGTVRNSLLIGLPPLLALLAFGTWLVVGRALRPVEAIRSEVADISGGQLDRRVPVSPREDEIGLLARTMNQMLDRMQAASERQRRFVADAAHELQSPLAAFRAHLEVARAHPDATEWRTTVSELLADSQRLERLVRDLLFLARTDGRNAGPVASPVDLDDVVLEEAARIRSAGRSPVDTSRVSAAPVFGSRDELARLTRNLLENADRYAATRVRVESGSSNGTAWLLVANDGPGIPAADRDRIFDRFTRLDGARDRGSGGTGLGLAIVKDIVTRHRGRISVEEHAGETRFVVVLPTASGRGGADNFSKPPSPA